MKDNSTNQLSQNAVDAWIVKALYYPTTKNEFEGYLAENPEPPRQGFKVDPPPIDWTRKLIEWLLHRAEGRFGYAEDLVEKADRDAKAAGRSTPWAFFKQRALVIAASKLYPEARDIELLGDRRRTSLHQCIGGLPSSFYSPNIDGQRLYTIISQHTELDRPNIWIPAWTRDRTGVVQMIAKKWPENSPRNNEWGKDILRAFRRVLEARALPPLSDGYRIDQISTEQRINFFLGLIAWSVGQVHGSALEEDTQEIFDLLELEPKSLTSTQEIATAILFPKLGYELSLKPDQLRDLASLMGPKATPPRVLVVSYKERY